MFWHCLYILSSLNPWICLTSTWIFFFLFWEISQINMNTPGPVLNALCYPKPCAPSPSRSHSLKVIMRPVIAFKQARWSALIKTSSVPWEKRDGKRGGGRLHNLSYQRAFPLVAKGRGKGAKHLLSRGIKDGHFQEMHDTYLGDKNESLLMYGCSYGGTRYILCTAHSLS